MDYTHDCCMALFTKGQVEVMRYVLQDLRTSLIGHGLSIKSKAYTLELDQSVTIYPNPASHFFCVDWTSSTVTSDQLYRLLIRNVQGQVVFQCTIIEEQKRIELCTNDLPRGLLFLSIVDEKGLINYTEKLIVQ